MNNINPIAEAEKSNFFQSYSRDIEVRLKLSIEVYKKREVLKLSQQKLAKEIGTTQKVISKIENAEVNLGIDLLHRITKALNFSSKELAEIFDCSLFFPEWSFNTKSTSDNNKFIITNEKKDSKFIYNIPQLNN